MAFISNPPDAAYDPEQPTAGTIAGDGFYPSVGLARLREIARISTVVTEAQLNDMAIGAIIAVRGELRSWRALREADGKQSLAAVSAEAIGGSNMLEHLYFRAIAATAAADLYDTRRDIGATRDGIDRTEDCETPSDWRRIATHAIRDILGVGRTAVELI